MKTKKIMEDLPGHADEVYCFWFMKVSFIVSLQNWNECLSLRMSTDTEPIYRQSH